MKIIFFGSDFFSLAALKACLETSHEVILIVTTPAQKKGRGLTLSPSPVQEFAESRGLPFEAPADLKDAAFFEKIKSLSPDAYVVSSYGKFIPGRYLDLPKVAALNVHPSLVPRYRGSGPIQWALLNGDKETGVSIIEVARKLDAGDIFCQVRMPILDREDHPGLEKRLTDRSYEVLLDLLNTLPDKPLTRTVQEESQTVYARKLTKQDGHLDWAEPAAILDRKVRALKPWPGTYVTVAGARLGILETTCLEEPDTPAPGTVIRIAEDQSLHVAAASGILALHRVQPEGKRPMSGADFARGKRLAAGTLLNP